MPLVIALPGLPVVGRLVDERIAVVHLVEVHGEIGGCARRNATARCCAPLPHGGRFGQVLRDVGPGLAAVARQLHEAVVGAGPDRAALLVGDSAIPKTTPAYSTPMLSGVSPPELPMPGLVVERQVRTDHLPALPAVRGAMHVLAAGIDRVADRAGRCEAARPTRSDNARPRQGRWIGAATLRRCETAGGSRRSARRCRRPCPSPDAEDQTSLESAGSGVAQPLSPPPTECHIARGMMPSPPPP